MRTRQIIYAAALIIFICCSLVWAESWYYLYQNALTHIDRKQWPQAVQALLTALQEKPDAALDARTVGIDFIDYVPHYYLGLAYYQMGKYNEARAALEKSSAFDGMRQRNELCEIQTQMLAECRAKLARPVDTPAASTPPPSQAAKTSHDLLAIDPQYMPAKTLLNAIPVQKSTPPVASTKAPAIPAEKNGNAQFVDTLQADGRALFAAGNMFAAREKFLTVLQLVPNHAHARTWLDTIDITRGHTHLQNGIGFYFKGQIAAARQELASAESIFTQLKNPDHQDDLLRTWQFLAVIAINYMLTSANPPSTVSENARQMVQKIVAMRPGFALERYYFSTRTIALFNELASKSK